MISHIRLVFFNHPFLINGFHPVVFLYCIGFNMFQQFSFKTAMWRPKNNRGYRGCYQDSQVDQVAEKLI